MERISREREARLGNIRLSLEPHVREARLARLQAEQNPDNIEMAMASVRAAEVVREKFRTLSATPPSMVSPSSENLAALEQARIEVTRAALGSYLERLAFQRSRLDEQDGDSSSNEPDGERVHLTSPTANDTAATSAEEQARPSFLSHHHQWNTPMGYDTSCQFAAALTDGEGIEGAWAERVRTREFQDSDRPE
ncbi:hypothetical protein V5O48_013379 [Marasmius crinis-equi]|uniref:Uncharacterized protein n=1 Tax=Marasmius crinis-equi TaxID=585013 RepID=A0ABR3F094_9AGAR